MKKCSIASVQLIILTLNRDNDTQYEQYLSKDDSSSHWIREGGDGREQLLVAEVNVGTEPALGHRRLVDDDRPADDRARAEEGQRRVNHVLLKVIPMRQVTVLAAQVAQLVLVEGPFTRFRARRRIVVGRVEVDTGAAARRVFSVELGRNRKLVDVETSGTFSESGKKDVDLHRMKRRSLVEVDRALDALVGERGPGVFPPHVPDLGASQESFRVVFVEQDEVERPMPVQFRKFEVDVGVDVLGEGALFFSDPNFAELSGEVAFPALGRVLLGAALPVLVHRIVEELKKIART